MKLRFWQVACIEQALKHYSTNQHFLCLATPGAGKTTMAAELAHRLFQRGCIDLVLCFAPSLAVVTGLRKSFSSRLNKRFDGQIGAIGGAYTYQSLQSLGDEFWDILRSHKVLVVFDEIHHCAGNELGGSNAWGHEIMIKIQDKASFTLALTGTPWRSDNRPIVLANYLNRDGSIQCDYSYGLKEAVNDQVCRKPAIVLIDNDKLNVTKGAQITEYNGLKDLLKANDIRYHHLLQDEAALQFCLALSCKKLDSLRKKTPNAGGLIVASTVFHAEKIAQTLRSDFDKTVTVVTYKHKGSSELIEQYRNNDQEWVVSVGMISEGTDIPRLQVCCHLSRITTELYFRQVLGRVLRSTSPNSQTAWLYTFAEPTLAEYAQRIAQEIPSHETLIFENVRSMLSINNLLKTEPSNKAANNPQINGLMDTWIEPAPTFAKISHSANSEVISDVYSLECLGSFRQKLIDLFNTDSKNSF